jgi:DNA-binding MarR family transcriptional regulator
VIAPRASLAVLAYATTFTLSGNRYIDVAPTETRVKNDVKSRTSKPAAGSEMLSYCNNASLRKAARRLGKLYDAVMEPSGLKATQFSLLTQIYDLGNPTMAELAKSLVMDLSAMRHSLGPLMRDGLVKLRVEQQDRRVKRVVLTAAGIAKFEEAMQLWQKAQGRFEKAFGSARAAKLRSELKFLASEGFEDAF